LSAGKLRPALVIGELPGKYGDWMISMISSQLDQTVEGFDETVLPSDDDFESSGLKDASVIRVGRLAVVDQSVLIGTMGPSELRDSFGFGFGSSSQIG
jgi:mRNA interferase MazF